MNKSEHILTFPAITVDPVIFTIENGELMVLLIKRTNEPFKGVWSLPGGFLHGDETSVSACERILLNKAGLSNVYLEQLYTFDTVNRDPRGQVVSVSYIALAAYRDIRLESGLGTQTPTFFPVNRLPKLAFDHKQIIAYAHKRVQAKLEYTNVAYSLLPALFPISELQKTYEIILGKRLDKRNFQKKIMSLGLLAATKKKTSGGRQRPAQLFRFVSRNPAELKKFF